MRPPAGHDRVRSRSTPGFRISFGIKRGFSIAWKAMSAYSALRNPDVRPVRYVL